MSPPSYAPCFHPQCNRMPPTQIPGMRLPSRARPYVLATRQLNVQAWLQIGPGCDVDIAEYSESLQVDPDARVDQSNYTGQDAPGPPPNREPVQPLGGERRRRVRRRRPSSVWSTWTLTRPVLKGLAATACAAVAAVVIVIVLLTVLPWVGAIVLAALGGAVLLLIGLALGLPVLIVVAVLFRLIMLPFEFLWWLAWGRRHGNRVRSHFNYTKCF